MTSGRVGDVRGGVVGDEGAGGRPVGGHALGGRLAEGVARSIRAARPPTASAIRALVAAEEGALGDLGRGRLADALGDRLVGLGPLTPLLADPAVTDVLVNGDGRVWVDRGQGVVPAGVGVPADELRPLATRLAGMAGRRLDDAQPWVDGILPGGVRLHAVLPPLADGGPHLSLRIARHRAEGVAALERLGAVGPVGARVLRALVAARASLLVTGGTGAGKTTVLGALLAECPPGERVVLVEDVRELAPRHPHVVRLQGRGANVEGVGAVGLGVLVRQALRMRPDRLVVGEVRGAEVVELLVALNTGHEGGASTLHANGPEEVPARVEALAALAGLPREAVHAQLRGAVHAVVHVARRDGVRHVASVGVLVPGERLVHVERAATAGGWPRPDLVPGPAWPRLVRLAPGLDDVPAGASGAPGPGAGAVVA